MELEEETSVGAVLDGSFSMQIASMKTETLDFTIASSDVDTGKYFIELVDLGLLGGDDYADSIDEYEEFETDVYSIGELFQGAIQQTVIWILLK